MPKVLTILLCLLAITSAFISPPTVVATGGTEVLCAEEVNDDFSGTAINSAIWDVEGARPNSNTIANGMLTQVAGTGSNVAKSAWLRLRNTYVGDFEAQVDISRLDATTGVAGDYGTVRIQAFGQESVNALALTWRKNETGSSLAGHTHRDSEFLESAKIDVPADQPVSMKLKRIGTTAEYYYDSGNGFEKFAEDLNVTTQPVTIGLSVLINSGNAAAGVTAEFDNFVVKCVEPEVRLITTTDSTTSNPADAATTTVTPSTTTSVPPATTTASTTGIDPTTGALMQVALVLVSGLGGACIALIGSMLWRRRRPGPTVESVKVVPVNLPAPAPEPSVPVNSVPAPVVAAQVEQPLSAPAVPASLDVALPTPLPAPEPAVAETALPPLPDPVNAAVTPAAPPQALAPDELPPLPVGV